MASITEGESISEAEAQTVNPLRWIKENYSETGKVSGKVHEDVQKEETSDTNTETNTDQNSNTNADTKTDNSNDNSDTNNTPPTTDTNSDNSSDSNSETTHATADLVQSVAKVAFSGDSYLRTGGNLVFFAELKDQNGNPVTKLNQSIPVKGEGQGSVNITEITDQNLQNGKVTLTYQTSVPETARVVVANEAWEIKAVDEVKESAAFRLYADTEKLKINQANKIYIQCVDTEGKDTPRFSGIGEIKLTIKQGSGNLSPQVLQANNFNEGKAEFSLTPASDGSLEVLVQNGAIYGEKTFSVVSVKELFSDVDNTHPNYQAIKYLKENEIIGGYPDGSFQPNKAVSRVEAVKMLIIGLKKGTSPSKTFAFPDTENNLWYSSYLSRAIYLDMV
ncbi:MAG TPA: S-layer homology domain-containing protein, partial [Candidatus Gracilibacteria bacterium]|nr:S-layer homology domain-containing protein [Candidatus Gracilibacteria bacterium]